MNNEEQIREAAGEFRGEFGLRGFPGKRFRVSGQQSYVSSGGLLILAVQVASHGGWEDFSKGTPGELRREVTP